MVEIDLKDREGLKDIWKGSGELLVDMALESGRVWIPELESALPSCGIVKMSHYVYLLGITPKQERAVRFWAQLLKTAPGCYIVPTSESWIDWLVENIDCRYRSFSRYALGRTGEENREVLKELVAALEEEFALKKPGKTAYNKVMKDMWSEDFSLCFEDPADYIENVRGHFIVKDKEIVSGCVGRSYEGRFMELVFATNPDYRRRNLALTAAAKLVLSFGKGKGPQVIDVRNQHSVELAQGLGFEFLKEYHVYQIYPQEDLETI